MTATDRWDDPAWSNPDGLGAVLGDQCPRCGYTRGNHHVDCPTQDGAA
jgi:hypothetical protein